jgi:leucyl/phenylalanyl-tRNA--protein transferase
MARNRKISRKRKSGCRAASPVLKERKRERFRRRLQRLSATDDYVEKFTCRRYSKGIVRQRKRSQIIPASLLLEAYCRGIFPMAVEDGEIAWFSPDPRGIIPLDSFHVPHGLRRSLRRNSFEVRINTAFEAVIRACGERAETWISPEIVQSYLNLHELGFAHSVETWRDNQLVGGLYGVSVYGAFFGESMFHRETDASKVALVALVERLREREFRLLDTQYTTSHLRVFGAVEIPRPKYLRLLKQALALDCRFD